MEFPTIPHKITFKGFGQSDAVTQRVLTEISGLEQFFPRIVACEVTLELSTKRHQQGNLFRVRVEIKVPGDELVAARDPHLHQAHEDLYVAIRDAFNACTRQLEDYSQQTRVRVHHKERQATPRGRVIRIFMEPEGGYGFIETEDSREVYFHSNSVLNDHFKDLAIGTIVRFTEEEGDKGPQASTVRIEGGHRKRSEMAG